MGNDVDLCVEIHRLENVGDTILKAALQGLFDGNTTALEVMKFKDLYQTVEEGLDTCERIANVFEAIVLKYA